MEAEESTDIPLARIQSTRELFLPDDCLSVCLEYLYKESDLESIRRASKQCNKMYQRYQAHQSRKFDILRSIIPDDSLRRQYWRIEDLLKGASLIPGDYVDFQSNHSIARLHDTKLHKVRGLSLQTNLPFISLRLWDENDRNGAALLICHFGFDGLAKVNIHWKTRRYLRYRYRSFPVLGEGIIGDSYHRSLDQMQHFSLADLNRVLGGEKSIQMQCEHGKLPSIWNLDRNPPDTRMSRMRRCFQSRKFPLVMSILLVLLIAFLIYFVLVFVVRP